MEDLSKKTILWVDNGLFHGFIHKLAPFFGRNFYYTPWQGSFASDRQRKLGKGFSHIERVNYPDDVEGKCDAAFFLDLFHADRARRLRRQGMRVWAAFGAEDLELDRVGSRQWAKRCGWEVAPADIVQGTDALRANLLKRKGRAVVKLADGYARGDMETWHWKGEQISLPTLNAKIHELGTAGQEKCFVIEEFQPDHLELGEDLFAVDGKYPDQVMQGMEVKGLGTVGVVKPYAQLPACLRKFNEDLAVIFGGEKARTLFCMEGLYNEKKVYKPMDPCMRPGSPSNELLGSLFTAESWARTLWDGSGGVMTSPKRAAKFGIVAMIYSEQSGTDWQALKYAPEVEPWLYLRNPYSLGGKRYAVPQGSPTNIAGVVGTGDTLLAAAKALGEHARMIDGNQIEIATDALLKMRDIIAQSNKWGATFTTDPLPGVEELKKAIG